MKDLKAVEDAAKSFSNTWAGTSKADFITASYDIKSGIASLTDEGVAQFTQLAALTGKATKSTTEEMGSLFATGYGIYKGFYDDMSDLEFGEMFSAGIATAVECFSSKESHMDWCRVELSPQLQGVLKFKDMDEASVELGYEDDFDSLIDGYVRCGDTDYWKEIMIKDDMMKLDRVTIKAYINSNGAFGCDKK